MGFYFDENKNYYEGDPIHDSNSIAVPQRPARDYYPVWSETDGSFVEWVLDEARTKRSMGRIPTKAFFSKVFVKPAGLAVPDEQYIWQRYAAICRVDPAIIAKLSGEYVEGTKADIEGLGYIYRVSDNTLTDVAVRDADSNIVSIPDGTIISEQEYQAILALVAEYGVQ